MPIPPITNQAGRTIVSAVKETAPKLKTAATLALNNVTKEDAYIKAEEIVKKIIQDNTPAEIKKDALIVGKKAKAFFNKLFT